MQTGRSSSSVPTDSGFNPVAFAYRVAGPGTVASGTAAEPPPGAGKAAASAGWRTFFGSTSWTAFAAAAGPGWGDVPVPAGMSLLRPSAAPAGAVGLDRPVPRQFTPVAATALGSRGSGAGTVAVGGSAPMVAPGLLAGLVFVEAVGGRHRRIDDGPAAPPAGAMTVRSQPVAAAGAAASPSPSAGPAAPPGFPLPVPQPAPAALPADLLPRLTEQVVRALDARALALRERFGRF
jgi:hypothetical protein